MFKGTPAVLQRARALARNGAARAAVVQQTTADDVLDRMRSAAADNPNWSGLADGITMEKRDDGSYTYGFDPQHPGAERAYELEFGTMDESPSPVFRKVLHGQRSDIEWNFRQRMRRA